MIQQGFLFREFDQTPEHRQVRTGPTSLDHPAPQRLIYYKVRKNHNPQIAITAVWGLDISIDMALSKCQRQVCMSLMSNDAAKIENVFNLTPTVGY